MKVKGSIFASKKVKELFESEGYTTREWLNFTFTGSQLMSRKYERMAYILTEGKINIVNLR